MRSTIGRKKPNKTDAGNGSKAICRVSNVLRSPSPDPSRSGKKLSHMPIDDRHFRPITFQGVLFPATLMGISILEPVLAVDEPELNEWLWRFPICCGVQKTDEPERCARCAERAMNLILERRDDVLAGIEERLATHGFDPNTTLADWLTSLERIAALSRASHDACVWSAPQHAQDPFKSRADADRFLAMAARWASSDPEAE